MHSQFAAELWSSHGVYTRYTSLPVILSPLDLEKMQVRGAATLLLQSSLLKTLQNQEVDCTLQQLEAGGVLLGMVKGQFCDFFFLLNPGAKAPKHCR